MKKIAALLLLLALLCPAARGEIEIVQSSLIAVEMYESYDVAYFQAEIVNTGNENRMIADAPLRIYGEKGELLYENSLFISFPIILRPGERGYLTDRLYGEDAGALAGFTAHSLEIQEGEPYAHPPVVLPVTETEIVEKEAYSGHIGYTLLLTVTNDQTETVFHPTAYYGLYDEKGALLFADGATFYDVGILPGQSVVLAFDVDASLYPHWQAAHTLPCSIRGGACIETE